MAGRSVAELATMAERDPEVAAEFREDPAKALAKYAFTEDPTFYRMAIAGLIGIIALVIVGAIVIELAADDKSLPDWIAALAATALGGLVGLFAPSPTSK